MSAPISRRQRNAIKDSDLPKKRPHPDAGHVLSAARPLKERYKSDIDKATPSELEEAQLLLGAGSIGHGNNGEGEVVYVLSEASDAEPTIVQHQPVQQQQLEADQAEQEPEKPAKPELTDEEIQQELQALLDSQLDPNAEQIDMDMDAKHLIKNRDQLEDDMNDDEDEEVNGETTDGFAATDPAVKPSKGFSAAELQAFMNNQIKRHNQQIQEEDQTIHPIRSQQQQQQHLVLITANGEKIILIQNPDGVGSEDGDLTAGEYLQPVRTEIDEQEEQQIQMQHKARQKMLLMQLERLREQHKQRLPASVTTPAVPHMQPIRLVPYPKPEATDHNDGTSSQDAEESPAQPVRMKPKAKKPIRRREGEMPKWLKPINNYLSLASKFVRRRKEKIEEIDKRTVSAASFEKRSQDMKSELLKIELTIERFQNTIGKELEDATSKFQTFLRDFHLEECIGEIEAEDETDEFNCNLFEPESDMDLQPKIRRFTKKNLIAGEGASEMQIITPSNISITSTATSDVAEPESNATVEPKHDDPFEFTPESEPLVDVKPVPAPNTSKKNVDELVGNHRPIRSARIQTRKSPDQTVRSPSRRRPAGRR